MEKYYEKYKKLRLRYIVNFSRKKFLENYVLSWSKIIV